MEVIKEDECDEDRYYQARNEWDKIETLPIIDLGSTSVSTGYNFDGAGLFPNIKIEELDTFINELDLSEQLSRIVPEIKRKNTVKRFLKRVLLLEPPPLHDNQVKWERDRFFALALKSFDDGQGGSCQTKEDVDLSASKQEMEFQTRMLLTVFRILTKCPQSKSINRISKDWESIGFQGSDPATDFRGVGLLGLYQLVHFVLAPDTVILAMDTFALSLDEVQSFPFSIMSINITSLTLQLLREGIFNRDINSKCQNGHPFSRCFSYYHSLAFKVFYQDWKCNKRTIKDAGFVIVDIRKTIKTFMRNYSTIPSILDSTLGSDRDKDGNYSGKRLSLRTLVHAWRMKLKGPNRYQRKKVMKSKSNDKIEEDREIVFTDLNVIQSIDSDAEEDFEFITPEPGIQSCKSDLEVSRPFTPYDDDSLDGASITKERRLI